MVAWSGSEYVVRRLGTLDGHVALLPDHPGYPPLVFHEADTCEVWGTVIYVLHDPNRRGHR